MTENNKLVGKVIVSDAIPEATFLLVGPNSALISRELAVKEGWRPGCSCEAVVHRMPPRTVAGYLPDGRTVVNTEPILLCSLCWEAWEKGGEDGPEEEV